MKLLVINLVLTLFVYHISTEETSKVRGRYGITYGKNANFANYPFFVRLWLKRGGTTFFCGGSIIDYNKILTAAHCVYGSSEFLVCVGSGSTYDTTSCYYVNDLSKVCVHKGFHAALKGGQFCDDLALITLNGNIFQKVPTGVALAPLCSACYTSSCVDYEGVVGTTIGCGETENGTLSTVLKEAGQVVIPQSEGIKKYSNLSPPSKYSLCFTKSSTADQRMSTCAGDSGSPVLFPNPITNKLEVCGVLSFGTANCVNGDPSAFTYLAKYIHFIKWGYESITLEQIKNESASVQSSFNSYSINMRPRSEAIWEDTRVKKDHNENVLKPNDDLAMHNIDQKDEKTRFTGIKLFFKAMSDFFITLAYG